MRTDAKIEEGKEPGDDVISRLRQLYKVPNNAALAAVMGEAKSTISSWRKRGVPDSICTKAAQDKGVAYEWLRLGKGRGPEHVEGKDEEAYVGIPFYDDVRFSGAGESLMVQEEQESYAADVIRFRASWIEMELHAGPQDLALLTVEGESMDPTLRPGDLVLVDLRDTTAAHDGIYALRMEGATLVKRLQRLPPNMIRVISDNEKYQPFTIRLGESENIGVIGRVVWAGRKM